MKRIMLVCCAGMSTSLLVTKMNAASIKQDIEVKVFAVGEADVKNHIDETDVVLLGPQVRYLIDKVKKTMSSRRIPVAIIDSMDYGTMNGERVLKQALNLIESKMNN